MHRILKYTCAIVIALFSINNHAHSQCEVYDFYDNLDPNPFWYACNGADYTLNLYSPHNWSSYTIDWGDGSPVESGTNWNSPDIISHTYGLTVQNFTVVISNPDLGCSITGTLVMEEATNPSIVIPTGVLTQACAPHPVLFSNQSSNVSENTVFTWDFGDGSPNLTLDYTNVNQTISHTYEENTVDCNTEVTLYAENFCNTIQGGPFFNTFSPIQIYDTDDASISASATTLCFPENEVIFSNSTERNCFVQGNIEQRYEYWNFGDYWGTGQDSIVDWTPWPPTNPYPIEFPGNLGDVYEIMMIDSNFCGLDTAYMTINIVAPPTAGITLVDDEVCEGDAVTINQNATGNPNQFSWNLGDGLGWIDTGGSNITYLYNTPGTYTIASAVGISSSPSCADTAYVDVMIVPSPEITIFADNFNGCDDITVNFTETSTNTDTWDWDFGNSNTFSGSSPPPQNYDTPGNYVVTVTGSNATGCLATSQELVTVYNSPTVDFIADNVCIGTDAQFTDLSISDGGDPIITWDWDFGDGFTSIEQHPVHQFAAGGTYNVTLTVSTIYCSATQTLPITVEDAPVPQFSPDVTSGCAPLDVSFENLSIGATTYTWTFGDQSGSSLENPTHTFYNFGTSDTTYTVILTAFSGFGCHQSDSLYITASPGAQASFTDNAQPPGCAPWTANFTNTSYGAVSYLWDFGDGSPTSTDENPDHLYSNTTGFIQTYDVQLIAYSNTGCNDTIVSSLTVFPEPDFTFDVTPNNGCTPLLVTMPLVASGQSFNWEFGDGQSSMIPNPTHSYENDTNAPIDYTVTLNAVSAFGCAGTSTSTLTVFPSPEADFTPTSFSGCSPLEVDFIDNSIGATTGTFDFGDNQSEPYAGSTTHTFTNNSASVQVYDVNLTLENNFGCTHNLAQPIEVTPSAHAEILPPIAGCSPYQVTLFNNSTNSDGFEWDFGNGLGSTQNNGVTTFFNNSGVDTTYTVTLLALSNTGCDDVTTAEVIVHSSPIANFTSDVNSGCSIVSVEFTNNSTGASSYNWNYGDGQTSATNANNHFHEFENFTDQPIEYNVTLTVENTIGCSDSYDLPITVYPQITAEFEQAENGCSPLTVNFDNESYGTNTDFVWDFGDGGTSVLSNPAHTFSNNTITDTTFTVELTTTSAFGCEAIYSQDIIVFGTPQAQLSISETTGCYPLDVTFHNESAGATSYSWVYGTGEVDNTTEEFHTHTFFNLQDIPVTYEVTLNAFSDNGCQSSDDVFVQVQPQLEALFNSPNEGCSPYIVQFENMSSGALEYQWDFGDGSDIETQIHPSHLFVNDTDESLVYTVTLTIQSLVGCIDVYTRDILVHPTPVAAFIATPISQTFPNATVELDNTSSGGAAVNYLWGFGDATANSNEVEPGNHTYSTWGNYTITLEADNGSCSSVTSQDIEIIPPPPTSDFEGPAKGCAPLTVSFVNNSEFAETYFWEFGDGGQAFVAAPTYTFTTPGTYSVRLITTGFGGETSETIQEDIIVVHPSAEAAFVVTPEEVSIPSQPVYCVNLSNNSTEYLWNFGDGNTSNEESPTHYYQTEGVYSITLFANNEFNCPDSLTLFDAVEASALGDIEFPNAFTPTAAGTGGTYDPQSFNNDVFFPIQSGVEDYQLQIFNRWGELLFESKDVNIGWDGHYAGGLCKQDVYVWKAKVKFSDGTELTRAGDVTLLR